MPAHELVRGRSQGQRAEGADDKVRRRPPFCPHAFTSVVPVLCPGCHPQTRTPLSPPPARQAIPTLFRVPKPMAALPRQSRLGESRQAHAATSGDSRTGSKRGVVLWERCRDRLWPCEVDGDAKELRNAKVAERRISISSAPISHSNELGFPMPKASSR